MPPHIEVEDRRREEQEADVRRVVAGRPGRSMSPRAAELLDRFCRHALQRRSVVILDAKPVALLVDEGHEHLVVP